MSESGLPSFKAGPFPMLVDVQVNEDEEVVEGSVGLIIGGLPVLLSKIYFGYDQRTWSDIRDSLMSDQAMLLVVGTVVQIDSLEIGNVEERPCAVVFLENTGKERLCVGKICLPEDGDTTIAPAVYAKKVIKEIINGATLEDLGETVYEGINDD